MTYDFNAAGRVSPPNRQYLEMLSPAKERLRHRRAPDIAEKAGIEFDEKASRFCFESLGRATSIGFPEYEMRPMLDTWHHLITLHYLDMADGTPLSPEPVSFAGLVGGSSRGLLFDRQSEEALGRFFGDKPPENVQRVCETLGAEFVQSNADLGAVFHYLPRYPVTLKLWFADDELGGSGKMLLNERAPHYLSVEDAVTVGASILETLTRRYTVMFGDGA